MEYERNYSVVRKMLKDALEDTRVKESSEGREEFLRAFIKSLVMFLFCFNLLTCLFITLSLNLV